MKKVKIKLARVDTRTFLHENPRVFQGVKIIASADYDESLFKHLTHLLLEDNIWIDTFLHLELIDNAVAVEIEDVHHNRYLISVVPVDDISIETTSANVWSALVRLSHGIMIKGLILIKES